MDKDKVFLRIFLLILSSISFPSLTLVVRLGERVSQMEKNLERSTGTAVTDLSLIPGTISIDRVTGVIPASRVSNVNDIPGSLDLARTTGILPNGSLTGFDKIPGTLPSSRITGILNINNIPQLDLMTGLISMDSLPKVISNLSQHIPADKLQGVINGGLISDISSIPGFVSSEKIIGSIPFKLNQTELFSVLNFTHLVEELGKVSQIVNNTTQKQQDFKGSLIMIDSSHNWYKYPYYQNGVAWPTSSHIDVDPNLETIDERCYKVIHPPIETQWTILMKQNCTLDIGLMFYYTSSQAVSFKIWVKVDGQLEQRLLSCNQCNLSQLLYNRKWVRFYEGQKLTIYYEKILGSIWDVTTDLNINQYVEV